MELNNLDPLKIGKFIRELRTSRNMDQQELGEKLFVTRKAISKWEVGRAVPSIDLLKRLAEVFDVSIEELINGEFDKKKTEIKKAKHKKKNYGLIFQSLCIVLFIILFVYFINNFNKVRIYNMYGDNCNVNGSLIETNEHRMFILNDVSVGNSEINELEGYDFEFKIEAGDKQIYSEKSGSSEHMLLKDYLESINVFLNGDVPEIKNPIETLYTLTIEYIDLESINQKYTLDFKMQKHFSNNKIFY